MNPRRPTAAAALLAAALLAGTARAASHSDAPLIKQDPQANLTDVYAFVGTKYDDPSVKVLNVVVHVRPFSEPGDGVMYDRFADDALYSIHIANPTSGATLARTSTAPPISATTSTVAGSNTVGGSASPSRAAASAARSDASIEEPGCTTVPRQPRSSAAKHLARRSSRSCRPESSRYPSPNNRRPVGS